MNYRKPGARTFLYNLPPSIFMISIVFKKLLKHENHITINWGYSCIYTYKSMVYKIFTHTNFGWQLWHRKNVASFRVLAASVEGIQILKYIPVVEVILKYILAVEATLKYILVVEAILNSLIYSGS